jgi:ceramide glucosyltransferase
MPEFTLKMVAWLWPICTLLALLGCAYSLFAAALGRRFVQDSLVALSSSPAVTILKPLCGAELELEANLASFCNQAYGGPVQLVFGIQAVADPAAAVVHRLIERFPDREIDLVVDPRLQCRNRKISNLINMLPRARHDVLVLSDSDIKVESDYLRRVVAALSVPGVGLATCLYRGLPVAGLWSSLSAASINQHFLPSVLVGLKLGLARPCFGSTIALRAETLDRIGGFGAFSNQLADDYAIGDAVRGLGLKVAIPPLLLAHICSEQSFGELVSHELRSARTLRLLDPWGYAGLVLTHALPLALVAASLQGFGAIGLGLVALALACRVSLSIQVEAMCEESGRRTLPWLSPLRDLLSFAIFLASFLPGPMIWRGNRYALQSDGTLTPS